MPSHGSSTTVCQECGKRNAASARFCSACAARLGAEPSIGAAAVPGATLASADGPHGAPRTVDSRPAELPARSADAGARWLKRCIGGLLILLGLMGWALYMLTAAKAPAPLAAGPARAAPEVQAAPPPLAAAPAAPAPAPAAPSPPAPADTAAAVAPSDVFPYTPPAPRGRSARVRARPAPADAVAPAGDASAGAWVEPSRSPAMTASPGYRDDGPPIVAGPGPVPAPGPAPGPAMRDPAPAIPGGGVARPADPGPPVVEGPGPHYDFSTPGARGR